MKRLLVMLLLLPATAFAQSTLPEKGANSSSTEFGSACSYSGSVSFYTLANPTEFTYLITTEGDLVDISILTSNGNDSIDAAAMACASKWHANTRGSDVAEAVGPHWAMISWSAGASVHFPAGGSELDLALTGTFKAGTGACRPGYYPPRAIRRGEEGTTTVQFYVEPDGSVRKASVYSSSGSRDLDNVSVACAKFWRFQPALENGKPTEVLRSIAIKWQLQR